MDFTGTGLPATDEDYAGAAEHIGCDEATIRAVVVVEAAGSGFDARQRPKILPEPHVFWRNLSRSQRSAAAMAGLAAPRWGDIPYDETQDARYARLARMMAIDERAALESCSWGLPQIMGGNARLAGFASVWDMVERFKTSEGAQLLGLAGYIIGAGLAGALVRRDWAAFARGYNGPGYSRNGYDRKLAAAYAREKGPTTGEAHGPTRRVLTRGDTGDDVRELQERLTALGFPTGGTDGAFGRLTEQAVKEFQKANNLQIDGMAGPATREALEFD